MWLIIWKTLEKDSNLGQVGMVLVIETKSWKLLTLIRIYPLSWSVLSQ